MSLARIHLALSVLATDPKGLGGLWLHARPGPVRDAVLAMIADAMAPQKIHPNITEEALLGGVDLTATLSQGKVVTSQGVLAQAPAILLTSAERCSLRLAAHLSAALDRSETCVIAVDEGQGDEAPPVALTERLGLFLDLSEVPVAALETFEVPVSEGQAVCAPDQIEALTISAAQLGIDSLRVPLFAVHAARALAAMNGCNRVTSEDLSAAAELVYAHRATVSEIETPPPEEAPDNAETRDNQGDGTEAQSDMLVEAAQAALPPDVLAALADGRAARTARGSGSGARRRGAQRGRPLPSRPGTISSGARVDIVATLRAAAPWQTIRSMAQPDRAGLLLRKSDIRVRRYEERADRLLIFAVDASGSSAMARLAEAKGAVEILLSEAYARRDHVALVAFRGEAAEILLPPTRSLVQTKRRLQALPGGGGTPLAAGLVTAHQLADAAASKGMTPTIALLTDGRGNIALDGQANRVQAAEDAEKAARLIYASGVPALVIDTAMRPQPALKTLADHLDGAYIMMPRADARRLSDAVRDATSE